MRLRRLLVAAVAATVLLLPSLSSADTHFVGRGTGKMIYKDGTTSVTCNAPITVSFVHRTPHFEMSEAWQNGSGSSSSFCGPLMVFNAWAGSSSPPPMRQCITTPAPVPINATLGSTPYTLTVSGTTYTATASVTYCSGTVARDVVTLRLGNPITYTHQFWESQVLIVDVSATLTRSV